MAVEGNRRLTWLIQAPLITMLDLCDARSPKPIYLGTVADSTAAFVGGKVNKSLQMLQLAARKQAVP